MNICFWNKKVENKQSAQETAGFVPDWSYASEIRMVKKEQIWFLAKEDRYAYFLCRDMVCKKTKAKYIGEQEIPSEVLTWIRSNKVAAKALGIE